MLVHLYCLHSFECFCICTEVDLNLLSKLFCFRIQLFAHRNLCAACCGKYQNAVSISDCFSSHGIINCNQRHFDKRPDHIYYRSQCRTGHNDHISTRHLGRFNIIIQAAAVFNRKLANLIWIICKKIIPEIMYFYRLTHIILQCLVKRIGNRFHGMD